MMRISTAAILLFFAWYRLSLPAVEPSGKPKLARRRPGIRTSQASQPDVTHRRCRAATGGRYDPAVYAALRMGTICLAPAIIRVPNAVRELNATLVHE